MRVMFCILEYIFYWVNIYINKPDLSQLSNIQLFICYVAVSYPITF